jgi:hypothetical protein
MDMDMEPLVALSVPNLDNVLLNSHLHIMERNVVEIMPRADFASPMNAEVIALFMTLFITLFIKN